MTPKVDTLTSLEPGESDWSRPDNRFLPLRACDLVDTLAADAGYFGLTPESLRAFAAALEHVIDHETGTFERNLADAYSLFNPDRDTLPMREPPLPRPEEYDELCEQLEFVLDKANYEELDDVQIAQAVMQARSRNLTVRVDPNRVEFLRLWVRGRGEVEKRERDWWRPWIWRTSSVPIFKRLVVLARLKNDPFVMLKLFKDIPEAEAEALLPHAEVTMTLWDRIKLWGTGASTLGMTIMKVVVGFAALWKLAMVILVGVGTVGIRSVLGYRNARLSRDWQRTRHLYFQNMGNNASALQLLVATVKQEEFKEALLAYLFALAPFGEFEQSGKTFCEHIEHYIHARYGVDVDFDIADAEQKLVKLGLCPAGAPQDVLPLDEAVDVLHELGQGPGIRMLELQ
ncbi:DUF3754 domain-containing protein [Aeoliella mucimassa]|uniref:DUF3754 domain-containing protein n=1 Tax=Aeoliella mucimassa TaxID=2527972 RepID=A0A518AMC7_9BACT|nr:DUF3754 domain-containing protein [Aeoliella mucimassa]QDU55867.1 hypothetical protein Pan181_20640 [Aeoliella mucimassa]